MKEQRRQEIVENNNYHIHRTNTKPQQNRLSYRNNQEDHSRFLKKSKSQTEDIMELERQLKVFEENGQIFLKHNYNNHGDWFNM